MTLRWNRSHHIPRGLRCPACHAVVGAYAAAHPGDRAPPLAPGQIAICNRCGSTLVATPGPGLRQATAGEARAFYACEPVEGRLQAAFTVEGATLTVRTEAACRQLGLAVTRENVEYVARVIKQELGRRYPEMEFRTGLE